MNKPTLPLPNLASLQMPFRTLLGPGPSLVDPRVLKAMGTPVIGHLDPYFLELMDQTQVLLRYLFQTQNRLAIPISGTGSAAMEAAIANLVEPGDVVLVLANGYFGLRLADMAKRYGGEVETLTLPWGEIFSTEEVQAALERKPAQVVALVHGETSTGALQPLEGIAQVVHAAGALLIVDTVTTLGGVPVFVDDLEIDACYSGGQKCLSAPPGISPISLGPRAVQKLRERKLPVANWYLDLSMVEKYWGKDRTYHHTAPISMNFALYEALCIIAEEGLEARWKRHLINARILWSGLEEIGLELHVPEEHRLPTLTTIRVPDGVDEAGIRQQLLERFNIEIGGGLGELKGNVWRVGLMGYSSREENIVLFLGALRKLLC
jgi:alanine-glyoxylate transaminase / serine-glyoxylate transaminase / serine-pyruvate transaminase